MKVSCLQENLARGLSIVGRAVATRSTLPVLSNLLLSTDESRLKLSATNLETSINCWVGAKVEQDGAITVPARLLADFVNSLPSDRIDMELITRTQTLNLRCGRFEANIKGIDAQEFPLIIVPDDQHPVDIDAEMLRQMVDQVAFSAATDESRPVLTGVLATFSTDGLTFAAADGYRLSVRTMPLEHGGERAQSVIIPARALQELRRVAPEADDAVRMLVSSDRNQVFFSMKDIELISQLVEGAFPDYRQIIPNSYNTKISVNTVDCLKAVRMAFVFARDSANIVRFQVIPNGEDQIGRLIISATSSEHGDNVSELDATIEGSAVEIAFNGRYLIEALSVIDTAEVSLEMRDASSPGVLRPVGGGDFVHIIMPMHIAR